MFRNIVIGIDGREGGHKAIELARTLAREDAELTLANVYGTRVLAGRGAGIALVWESEASESLLEHEREQARLPGADILRSSQTSVGRGLHEIAEEVKADLLVIGATHRRPSARALLGDDTAAVLHGAPCPVAIAQLHDRPVGSPPVIGAGYDGTPESARAVSVARNLANQLGARLRVLAVAPVHVEPYWETTRPRSPEARELEAALAHAVDLTGLNVEVMEGDPAEQLTICSKKLDLMVLATRDPGLVGRLLTGSVARHLALHSACSLLVCPPSFCRTAGSIETGTVTNIHL